MRRAVGRRRDIVDVGGIFCGGFVSFGEGVSIALLSLACLDVLPSLAAGGGEVAEIQISELGPCGSRCMM